jgi:hypothetical protein
MKCNKLPLALLLASTFSLGINAQTNVTEQVSQGEAIVNPAPFHLETYGIVTSTFNGQNDAETVYTLAYTHDVSITSAPWLQLKLDNTNLGSYSYIEITSVHDGSSQRLTQSQLQSRNFNSAFFNGSTVTVKLFVHQNDSNVEISIPNIVVGEHANSTESICGTVDNRIASSERKVARIDPIGCTGWTTSSGLLLTAGHCLTRGSSNRTLSFNPPASLSDGTIQYPSPENQYTIDQSSFNFVNGGRGNDWGIFKAFKNTVTGKTPTEAQGGFQIKQDLNPAVIRITGFGVDNGSANQTTQTHTGPNDRSSGTTMRYKTDSKGGNSGGPVIDEATGKVVGIHTHGGCRATSGSNAGTSFFNTKLWNAVSNVTDPGNGDGGGDNTNCSSLSTWSAGKVYLASTEVKLNGKHYKANWWNKNKNPISNSKAWGIWTEKGQCK